MRIECPACAAAYDVPETLVPPGREVRCARCGRAWIPVPEADDEEAPAFGPQPAATPPASGTGTSDSGGPPPLPANPASIRPAEAPLPGPGRTPSAPAASREQGAPPVPRRGGHPLRPRPRREATLQLPEPPPPPPPAPEPAPGMAGPLLAWGASLLLVAAALLALWVWRAEVMAAWPPATRLYQALGLG